MSKHYILDDDKNVVQISNIQRWGITFEDIEKRRVDKTILEDDVEVSTVFLGLDHQWGVGPPILFETMVFGGEWDDYQERYSTWDEAVEGHKRTVEKIKVGLSLQEEND